jgi:hypothetical protein
VRKADTEDDFVHVTTTRIANSKNTFAMRSSERSQPEASHDDKDWEVIDVVTDHIPSRLEDDDWEIEKITSSGDKSRMLAQINDEIEEIRCQIPSVSLGVKDPGLRNSRIELLEARLRRLLRSRREIEGY